MFQQWEEPRFTIEQIDLLQRLRRTGITKNEVLHALDTLDHLDRQHGHKLTHKSSYIIPSFSSSSSSTAIASSSMTSIATQTTFPDNGLLLSPSNDFDTTSPPLPPPVVSPLALAVVAQNGLVAVTNGKLSPPRFPLGAVAGSVMGPSYGFETSEEDLDVDDKVEELMRRDSAALKDEIKSFLANRRISQAVVAQVTGISQSRISHWLLQQGSDLSEQKKRAFFRWYQLEKSTPGATLAMRAAPLALDDIMEWHQAPPSFVSTPGSFRLRRGSRFTWRKECLVVMESYFSDNQYPDEAKREEIANACNVVIQKPGKKLSDLERVTSLKVYNWFANRRKDLKRRANIEAAILESHGVDVQSPEGQSNSDEVDGNEFPDQVPTLIPGWYSALGRGGLSGQRGSNLIGRSLLSAVGPQAEGSRLTGASWSLQEEATIHNMLSEPQDPLALTVEKDAVHHTGLTITNQVDGASCGLGSAIKTEALEDD